MQLVVLMACACVHHALIQCTYTHKRRHKRTHKRTHKHEHCFIVAVAHEDSFRG